MAMNLGTNNVNECKQIAFDLNVEPYDDDNHNSPDGLYLCSICHEPLVNNLRTLVTLKCAHKFHLDCIGSTFNANNLMQCPNCMQIEPGQWQYGTGGPILDSDDEDWIDEENYIAIHDMALGSELCPFESLGQQNSVEGPDLYDLNNHCIYIEGSFAIPQSLDIFGSIYLPFNSCPLYPDVPLPSNPRIIWSTALAPGVMRGRHYTGHPSYGHGPCVSDNLMVNAPVATLNQGCSLLPNVPSDLSAPVSQVHVFPFARDQISRELSNYWSNSCGSNLVNDNGLNRINVWDHQPVLEQWKLNQMERQFYRILYGEEVGGSESNDNENGSIGENSSCEGRGNDRNSGDLGK